MRKPNNSPISARVVELERTSSTLEASLAWNREAEKKARSDLDVALIFVEDSKVKLASMDTILEESNARGKKWEDKLYEERVNRATSKSLQSQTIFELKLVISELKEKLKEQTKVFSRFEALGTERGYASTVKEMQDQVYEVYYKGLSEGYKATLHR